MKRILSLLTGLVLLLPATGFAAAGGGAADLGDVIRGIYTGFGEEIHDIMTNDSLSLERKFQTLSNASKTRHDAAMAAIQNTR